MQRIFSNNAVLEMNVKTENIAFPSKTEGLDLITDVLVNKFNESYENILTFCLSDSIEQSIDASEYINCRWLVGMTTKDNGELRIGHGIYEWKFDKKLSLVNHLIITIDEMVILDPQNKTLIMSWLNRLPYPWCETIEVNNSMPKIEGLVPII